MNESCDASKAGLYCKVNALSFFVGGYLEISHIEVLSDVRIPRQSALSVISASDANFLLNNRSVIDQK